LNPCREIAQECYDAANGVAVLSADPGESGNPGVSSAVQGFVSISGGLPGGIFVDENTAPGLLFASTDDPIVPYSWSVRRATRWRASTSR